ncbi:hypothetical protein [Microbacterium soli]|uniref:Gluconate 2-dehydrogenase subunit 3 family protein n=1 Tax=Microbacterium soli TaxID=446075 RepID=A0ABP7MSY6_9MICO
MSDERSAAERDARIARIADAMIPAADGALAASQAGVPGVFLDRAIGLRPDLAPVLEAAAEAVADGTPAGTVLADWERTAPARFDRLYLLIRGAYFLNPAVTAQLGYDGATPHPLSAQVAPDYADLLDAVISAGPRYRPIGAASSSVADSGQDEPSRGRTTR